MKIIQSVFHTGRLCSVRTKKETFITNIEVKNDYNQRFNNNWGHDFMHGNFKKYLIATWLLHIPTFWKLGI